jgi:hypothetical protein
MKGMLIAGMGLCLVSTNALAYSGVSPKFDGAYAGTADLNPRLSRGGTCDAFPVGFTVQGGAIHGASEGAAVDGFVTEEGFIRGHLKRGNGPVLLVEGRVTGDQASAAMIDDAAKCAWQINLTRK